MAELSNKKHPDFRRGAIIIKNVSQDRSLVNSNHEGSAKNKEIPISADLIISFMEAKFMEVF